MEFGEFSFWCFFFFFVLFCLFVLGFNSWHHVSLNKAQMEGGLKVEIDGGKE